MTNLYLWGKPVSPQFHRLENKHKHVSHVRTPKQIQNISCGMSHAFLLTKENQLFVLGSNEQGQCGTGYESEHFMSITRVMIETKTKIVQISCGWHHTLVLDQIGCVYSAGSGQMGATGQGVRQNSYRFKQIMTGARRISAGMDHSLAIKATIIQQLTSVRSNSINNKINNQYKVYGWGNNDCGQLGLHAKKSYLTPQQLNIYPCENITAGPKYSIFITVKGVYGCGLNSNFQLGLGHQRNLPYAKDLNLPQELQEVHCGNYCIGVTKSKKVYIWGSGALGIYKYPTRIQYFDGCDKLCVGMSFGMATKNKKIYVWGANNYNQLGYQSNGLEVKSYAYVSPQLTQLNLSQFSCGGDFALGINHHITEENLQEQNRHLHHSLYEPSQQLQLCNDKTKYSLFTQSGNYHFRTTLPFENVKSREQNQSVGKVSDYIKEENHRLNGDSCYYGEPISRHVKQSLRKVNNLQSKNGSMYEKALSDQTVKRQTMKKPTMNQNHQSQQVNQIHPEPNTTNKLISQLASQLSQLKSFIMNQSLHNQQLQKQNQQMKHLLKEKQRQKMSYKNQHQPRESSESEQEEQEINQQQSDRKNISDQDEQPQIDMMNIHRLQNKLQQINNQQQNPSRLNHSLASKDHQNQRQQDPAITQQFQHMDDHLYQLKQLLQLSLPNNDDTSLSSIDQ